MYNGIHRSESVFNKMFRQNEMLWQEVSSLRQQHANQSRVIKKVNNFLNFIVQPAIIVTVLVWNFYLELSPFKL